jgi:hypothetical protein
LIGDVRDEAEELSILDLFAQGFLVLGANIGLVSVHDFFAYRKTLLEVFWFSEIGFDFEFTKHAFHSYFG